MCKLWASWTCWAIGHAASRCIINRWFEWPYLVENRFMNWSVALQGNDEQGPWWPEGTDTIKRDE